MAETFTVPACPAIEARIASDLGFLRDGIVQAVGRSHIRMLAVGGGFGRGEGTAFMANGRPHIVNDYDIRIVHDISRIIFRARYAKRLHEMAERYARQLEIKQIDLGDQSCRGLSHIPAPTIASYEFLHGYYVFYGEDLLAPVAACIAVEQIPLWEGTWLLRNRSIGLILAGMYFIGGRVPSTHMRENLWIEANKAVLAAGDAFLLAQGCYHWSYVERGRRMANWPGVEAEPWREMYCRAVDQKVNPGGCPYEKPIEGLIQDWYRARNVLEQAFHWFESRRTGRECTSWADYLDQCVEAPAWRRPRFWANILRVHAISPVAAPRMARLRTERTRSVGLAARLLFAIDVDGVDGEAVEHVARVVGMQLTGTSVDRWRKLAALLLSSIHPGGEAGRAAALV